MSVPEHLWRHPTEEAIESLGRRFRLPITPDMQDWEYEVADPSRIDEFWKAYTSEGLTDDEQFALMQTVIQSFEDLEIDPESDPRWHEVLKELDQRIEVHIHTVWYWSCVESDDLHDCWRVTPSIRRVLQRHRARFEKP